MAARMKCYAVVEERSTGFGPSIFAGELRDRNDRPIAEHLYGGKMTHIIFPVTIGATAEEVFAALDERARGLR
jgi:hypothetical protein